jgi:hypothetical protein
MSLTDSEVWGDDVLHNVTRVTSNDIVISEQGPMPCMACGGHVWLRVVEQRVVDHDGSPHRCEPAPEAA